MKALVCSLLLLAVAGISVSGVLTWSAGSARGAGAPATGSPPALPSDGSEQAGDPRTLRACPLGAPQPDCGYHGLQGALAAALPRDRVVLAPGIYEEGAVIETPGLVLRGEPGAHLRDHAVEGKAALAVKADGVVIEGIECSGIAVRDNNGACVRIEGDDLTVRHVHFHDNQEGILSGPGGGQGQRVEASLTGGLISMLAYFSAQYFATGRLPERTGNDHPVVYPYGLFHAADGEVAIAPSTQVHVRRFLEALDLGHLLEDPAFADNDARMRHRERLRELIDARIGEASVEVWIERLNRARVPCGRVMDLGEVFADPQVLAHEMVLEVEHPGHGPVRMTGFPIKLGGTPARIRRPAPALGEHTEAVLRELGYAPDRIAALQAAKII